MYSAISTLIDPYRNKKTFMETGFSSFVTLQTALLEDMRDCSDIAEFLSQAQEFVLTQQTAKTEYLNRYDILVESKLLSLIHLPVFPQNELEILISVNQLNSDPILNVADPMWTYFLNSIVSLSLNGTSPTSLTKCCDFIKGSPRWSPDLACLTRESKKGLDFVLREKSAAGIIILKQNYYSHPFDLECVIGLPSLCLEVTQSSESILVLNDVKRNLQDLPDSTNIASEWSRILGPLDNELFSSKSDADDDADVNTSYHYDVDAVIIGVSHDDCHWANICSFGRDERSFKLVFHRNRRGASAFRGKFLAGNVSRPLWMLPQALIAQAAFGNLEFDLVIFGPENADKGGFEAQISRFLCDSIEAAIADPDMPLDSISILNHVPIFIRNTGSSSSTYSVSDAKACSLLLGHLQRRLSSEHHIFLIDLGCKSRSCTAGGARIKTLRGHSTRCSDAKSSPLPNSSDYHDSFKEILKGHLNLEEVEHHATFMLADFGIEFTSPGRFMHWNQDACKTFKTAMGGKGASFYSFGLRQLANFDCREMEFER
jgi:hypothetical protein